MGGIMRLILLILLYVEYCCCTCECPVGKYGDLCDLDCPKQCWENVCGALTGNCLIGCKPGFNGTTCDQACPFQRFGRNCKETCVDCIHGCNPVSGICIVGANICDPGFKGAFCNETCPPMTYGLDCAKNCGLCKNSKCNAVDGTCNDGCLLHGEGPSCTLHCPTGKYGSNCDHTCSIGCRGVVCAPETGDCLEGCADGYRGEFCTEECESMKYGPGCKMQCGLCVDSKCDPVNGTCLLGCISPGTGSLCDDPRHKNLIIGIVIGAVVLIILVVFLTLLCCKCCKAETKYSDPEAGVTDVREEGAPTYKSTDPGFSSAKLETVPIVPLEETEYGSGKQTEVKPPPAEDDDHDMTLEDLANVVKQSLESDGKFLRDQFKTLPPENRLKQDAANRLKNINKNTTKSVLPYDHSRVVLTNEEKKKSDYINASFVDGVQKLGEYIASQVPKVSTVNDYWHMIWQEDVEKVVTLCNVNGESEGEEIKLIKHWPDFGRPLETRDFVVLRTKMKKYASFIVRHVKLIRKKTKEEKNIIMHHFLKWSPKKTPHPLDLALFHRNLKSEKSRKSGPLLVSCSDGAGRTGTFIALDALHKYGNEKGHVNVFSYIRKSRGDRMKMVQNEDLYVFLHHALAESFKQTKRAITHQKNEKQYIMISDEERQKTLTPLQRRYLDVISDKPEYKQDDYGDALKSENTFRNIANEPLPVEKYRPRLKTKFNGHTDYINATFISSYTEADLFIATRFPLEETVVDLWRLIFDYKATSLVIIGTNDGETTRKWLPKPLESYVFDMFEVSRDSEAVVSYSNIVESKVKVVLKGSMPITVKLFRTRAWDPSSLLPPSYDVINTLVNGVKKWRESRDHEKVLVISKDGIQGCGLFSAVYNLREQMDMDGYCDLYNTVRQIHVRCPELLVSFEEFDFCQKGMKEYGSVMVDSQSSEHSGYDQADTGDIALGGTQTPLMEDEKVDSLTDMDASADGSLEIPSEIPGDLASQLLQKLVTDDDKDVESTEEEGE